MAFFQKAHEVGSSDWSSEGHAFVKTARLEQAIDSKPRIYYFADEYDAHFKTVGSFAASGEPCFWEIKKEPKQVSGLGHSSGWVDLVYKEHIPGGKIQS